MFRVGVIDEGLYRESRLLFRGGGSLSELTLAVSLLSPIALLLLSLDSIVIRRIIVSLSPSDAR